MPACATWTPFIYTAPTAETSDLIIYKGQEKKEEENDKTRVINPTEAVPSQEHPASQPVLELLNFCVGPLSI